MQTAADIMTRQVFTIRGTATLQEALAMMQTQQVKTLIVKRRHPQDAYGMITHGDIAKKAIAYGRNLGKTRVYEVMTKPCIVVNPELAVPYVARLFAQTGIACAPVIQGELLGIITLSDLVYRSDVQHQSPEDVLRQELAEAIARAQSLCRQQGEGSPACLAAWTMVEDIQGELAHYQAQNLEKTALEEYLETHPNPADTAELENWCSG